ncbi:MAG: FAD-binding oxidoreductase [Terriglobales bacterium]
MSATASAAGLARELAAIAGEQHATEDPARTAAFAIDEVVPRAVVEPGSAEEVAAAMKYAHAHELVVVPAGGFTHQFTGAIPEKIDIVLRTSRLKAVEHYDPGDLMIGVGAGTTLAEVERQIGPHQQMVPLDAPQPEKCTVGGALASAAQGPLKQFYGGLRDYCTGVRFVTADGKVAKAGAKVVKNVAGYDLMKLLIGSFGTVAVITGASLKLFSRPRQTRTFIAKFAAAAEAVSFRDRVLGSPLAPLCLELVSPDAQAILQESPHPVSPPRYASGQAPAGETRVGQPSSGEAWRVLLRAGGSDTVLARYRAELGSALTEEAGGEDDREMWRHIAEFPHLLFERSQNAMLVRVDVALQDVGAVLVAAQRAAMDNNFVGAVMGRMGAGSLLVGFAPIAVDPPAAVQYVNALSFLRGAVPRDGSAIVLRCPVEAKRHFSVWGSTPNDLATMQAIKHAFDGKNILNRGRFLF